MVSFLSSSKSRTDKRSTIPPQEPPTRPIPVLHTIHISLLVLLFIVSISFYTQARPAYLPIDGRPLYITLLCILSLPLLAYNALTGRFEKTSRFSQPYVHFAVDLVQLVLWVAAWISMATYITEGEAHVGRDATSKGGCAAFRFGSVTKCRIAEAETVLAALVFLVVGITSWFSGGLMMYYRRTGMVVLPTQGRSESGGWGRGRGDGKFEELRDTGTAGDFDATMQNEGRTTYGYGDGEQGSTGDHGSDQHERQEEDRFAEGSGRPLRMPTAYTGAQYSRLGGEMEGVDTSYGGYGRYGHGGTDSRLEMPAAPMRRHGDDDAYHGAGALNDGSSGPAVAPKPPSYMPSNSSLGSRYDDPRLRDGYGRPISVVSPL